MKRIYADNAATTRISEAALFEMKRAALAFPGNPSSAHEEGRKARAKLEEYRARCAACLDCEPNEIIFTSGATEGNQAIIYNKWFRVVSGIEHPSNMESAYDEIIPVGPEGVVTKWESFADSGAKIISVMTANNEIGTIQPVQKIAALCRSKRILFHTDATAAVGHIPVSFRDIGADFLTCSAHKFHGPRGVGILVVRNGTDFEPLMTGGKQERGRRAGTENLPAVAGMTVALEESVSGMREAAEKTLGMRERLMDGLLSIPGTILNGARSERLPGNVNVSFDGIEGESLLTLLDANGIAASAGSACHTGTSEPSHVLTAIGRTREQANASLRLSIDETNTDEEIETIVASVSEAVSYLRRFSPNRTK